MFILAFPLLIAAEGNSCAGTPVVQTVDHPSVYTSGASRGVFIDGVMDAAENAKCAQDLGDQRTDYSLCCADGFAAVGLTAGGDVVCVETR